MKLLAALVTVVPPLWILVGMARPEILPPFLNSQSRAESFYQCWRGSRALQMTLHSHVSEVTLDADPSVAKEECVARQVPAILTGEDPVHTFTEGSMAALQHTLPEGHRADDIVVACKDGLIFCLRHSLGTGEAQGPISARARLEDFGVQDVTLLSRASTELNANASAFAGMAMEIERFLQLAFLTLVTWASFKLGWRLAGMRIDRVGSRPTAGRPEGKA